MPGDDTDEVSYGSLHQYYRGCMGAIGEASREAIMAREPGCMASGATNLSTYIRIVAPALPVPESLKMTLLPS